MKRLLIILLLLSCLAALAQVYLPHRRAAFRPAAATGSFTPADLASMICWYSADYGVYEDAGTDAAEDGDAVVQWNDQSGNARNCVMFTSSNQPIYRASSFGSKPTVQFNVDCMTNGFGSSFSQPNTVFAVLWVTNIEGTFQIAWDGLASGNRQDLVARDGSYNMRLHAGTEVTVSAGVFAAPLLVTVLYSGAASTTRTNGVPTTTVNAGTHSWTGITLGARFSKDQYFYYGTISELIAYNADHFGTAGLTNCEKYLATKYGITIP